MTVTGVPTLRFGDKIMSDRTRSTRDAFTFSLGGMKAISSFIAAPAIAHDRINSARDARVREPQNNRAGGPREYPGIKGRFWLLRRRRAV